MKELINVKHDASTIENLEAEEIKDILEFVCISGPSWSPFPFPLWVPRSIFSLRLLLHETLSHITLLNQYCMKIAF